MPCLAEGNQAILRHLREGQSANTFLGISAVVTKL